MSNYNQAQGETLENIKFAVYEGFNTSLDELSTQSYDKAIAKKKRLICWVLKTKLFLSNEQTAKILGLASNSVRHILLNAWDDIFNGKITVSEIKQKSNELYSKLSTFEV